MSSTLPKPTLKKTEIKLLKNFTVFIYRIFMYFENMVKIRLQTFGYKIQVEYKVSYKIT